MQANALNDAQSLVRQAGVLFIQARDLSPHVAPVGEFTIPFEGFVYMYRSRGGDAHPPIDSCHIEPC